MAGIAEESDAQLIFSGLDTFSMMYSSIVALGRAASLGEDALSALRLNLKKRRLSKALFFAFVAKGGRVVGDDANGLNDIHAFGTPRGIPPG